MIINDKLYAICMYIYGSVLYKIWLLTTGYRTNGEFLHSVIVELREHKIAVNIQCDFSVIYSDVAHIINTPLIMIVCSCVRSFSNSIVVRYYLDTFSLLGERKSLLNKEGGGGRNKADWGKRGRQRSRIILIPSRWLMQGKLCQYLPRNHYLNQITVIVCSVKYFD